MNHYECDVCGKVMNCSKCNTTSFWKHEKGCNGQADFECKTCLAAIAKLEPWAWEYLKLILDNQNAKINRKLDDHENRYKHEYGSDNW